VRARSIVGFLHLVQPLARLVGRIEYGLTLWRSPVRYRLSMMKPRTYALWNERWHSTSEWLEALEKRLRDDGAVTTRGGEYDSWDLDVRGGTLGFARLRMLVEEHGGGRQLGRFRTWPNVYLSSLLFTGLFGALAVLAGINHAWVACVVLGMVGWSIAARAARECAAAMEVVDRAIGGLHEVLDRQR
jgi:hypothetical protein